MLFRSAIVASAVAAALTSPPALAEPAAANEGIAVLEAIEKTLGDVIAQAEPSVVAISRTSPNEPPRDVGDLFQGLRIPLKIADESTVGAGVIIDPAGLVLTQYLVVHEGDQHTVTTRDGQRWRASIKAADPRSGLAVLAIDTQVPPLQRAGDPPKPQGKSSFPAIRFGDADQLHKGQFVVAIGNPYAITSDGQATASLGTVTNLARKLAPGTNWNDAPGPNNDYRTTVHHLGTLIQTDAKLGWNAGGGALVNLRGELVGLTTTAATIAGHEQPAGYAIPINAPFRRVIDTLKEGKEVEYGLLGMGFGPGIDSNVALGRSNTTIGQVFPGSPAAHAGLQQGDVVTRVNDRPAHDVDDVQLIAGLMPPGAMVSIAYTRGSNSASTQATLTKLAVPGNKIVTNRLPSWRGIQVDYSMALDAAQLAESIASGAYDPQGCVLVAEVDPDSIAENAGVRPGMFISHVGTQRVTTPDEFRTAVQGIGESFDIRLTKPLEKPANNTGQESRIPDGEPLQR